MNKFQFVLVEDELLLQKVYSFRHKVLHEIYPDYLKESGLIEGVEFDKYDQYAIHFAALDQNGELCATVRLIHHSPIGYPTENSLEFNKDQFKRSHLGELSRIFIDKRYRNLKDTKIIIDGLKKILYYKMKELDIHYTYGSLEKSFLRLLRIYKMDYQTLGEPQVHGLFGTRYPSILKTDILAKDNGYE